MQWCGFLFSDLPLAHGVIKRALLWRFCYIFPDNTSLKITFRHNLYIYYKQ